MGLFLRVRKIPFYFSWKGLLGTKKPEAILIRTRFGIHTFGLFYPIDVIVIDKESVVRVLRPNLLPNRIFVWNPKYSQVLELPAGTIEKRGITNGTKLNL